MAGFGAKVLNEYPESVKCWTGEPMPSTNNEHFFHVNGNGNGGTSPNGVDVDHVKAPSGQWYKCGEDLTGVRVVVVERGGAVRNAKCKTNGPNQDCAELTETERPTQEFLDILQREMNEAHERIDTLEKTVNRLVVLTMTKIAGQEAAAMVALARGYRWTCQAPGHGSPRTQNGACKATYREARDDLQSHADTYHDGSIAGAAIGGCDL